MLQIRHRIRVFLQSSRHLSPMCAADTFIKPGTINGDAILAADWAATSLGALSTWPMTIRAQIAVMLACPRPMYLAWGKDLNYFYNDAYTDILGDRLSAIGEPFAEVWASVWSDIAPIVDAALKGEGTSLVDLKLDLARGGVSEETWWSFTFSPVYGDEGEIVGLLCVTNETTDRILTARDRDSADERLELALSAGNSIGAWDWDVLSDRLTADTRFASLYGVDPEKARIGAPIGEFFMGIHPEDQARVEAEIQQAMATGSLFTSEYRLLNPEGVTRWVSAQGRCILDENGRCVRFPGVSFDVTDRMLADIALKAAKDEREFVIALTSRQRALGDPDAIMRISAEALAVRLNVNRVGFYRMSGADRVRYGPCWSDGVLSPLVGDFPVSQFGSRAQQYRTQGRVLSFSDSRHDPAGGLEEMADAGILAGIGVPIVTDGRWQTGVFANHSEVRAWTAAEIALVREVGELAWLAVERSEALIRLADRIDRQDEALVQGAKSLKAQSDGRQAAESQVRQLQKMEAVGQLTGGIAHDFNNMLAVIIGGLNLMERRLARGETDVIKYVEAAMEGANRAATLTQRLLAFSRQSPLAPEPVDANRLIADMTDMLVRTLGEQINVETVHGAGLWRAKVDPSELENVLLNLSVNARDAMPSGGHLTIETSNAHVDQDYAREYEIEVGQYVMLAVTDTGTGMTREVMSRAFDPFYTTKETGKGTGLGLSQVFGFVRQSGGSVKIYSEVGHGTTFKIYLPRHIGDEVVAERRRVVSAPRGGELSEIVLVVEDEERVRNFSTEVLRELGYTVIHAANGSEALAILDAGQDVTLLFTDIIMPGMTGRELADRAQAILPDLKVIYTTGYTRNAVVHNGQLDPGTNFLAKPFGIDQLAAKVRDVLDET